MNSITSAPLNPISILLIEDDIADKLLFEEILHHVRYQHPQPHQYQVEWASTLKRGIEMYQAGTYDIVLADLTLPDSQGFETIERITQNVTDTPVVLITGLVNEELTLNVIRYGVQDYLVKGEFNNALLIRTLHYAIERYRMEQRQAVMAQLQFAIQQPYELQTLLARIAHTVTNLLPASIGASILLWDAHTENFTLSASTVPNQAPDLLISRIRRKGGVSRRIVDTCQAIVVPDLTRQPDDANKMLAEYGIRAFAGIPVMEENNCLGVLYALDSHVRVYTQNDLDFLSALANRAGLAISRVRLFEQLRAQAADLAAQNTELDAFSHSVAHDLKNLLTSVIGYSELLIDEFDYLQPAERTRYLETIIARGRKMQQVIDGLLTMARLRKIEIKLDAVAMGAVVAEALERLQELSIRVGARFSIQEEWPVVYGNGSWLEEAWVNYVSNALKYGGTPPHIMIGATETNDGSVRFWVQDNGPGIHPDDQARLFTPFVRLAQNHADGHGLGLSIVQRIVEKCNGRVGVESVPGGGSTFWFELPLYSPKESDESAI
jgi:signal transduction histidine kinase/CheY-like chemotaxis protein